MKRITLLALLVFFLTGKAFTQMANTLYSSNNSQTLSKLLQPEFDKKKKDQSKVKKEVSFLPGLNFYAGADVSFGFPIGKIRDTVGNGFGFTVRAEYFLFPELSVGLMSGFKSYKYDEVMVGEGHYTYIPINLTGTYYFNEEKIRPYGRMALGMYSVRQKYDFKSWILVQNQTTHKIDTIFEIKGQDVKQMKFGLSPSVGILYNFWDDLFANANFTYELIFTESKPSHFLSLNFGVIYKFGF